MEKTGIQKRKKEENKKGEKKEKTPYLNSRFKLSGATIKVEMPGSSEVGTIASIQEGWGGRELSGKTKGFVISIYHLYLYNFMSFSHSLKLVFSC